MNEVQPIGSEFGLTPEIKANQKIYFEYFDKDYAQKLAVHIGEFLMTYYFRARVVGLDKLPERSNPDRPLIYISNHSGMAFPWDGMMMTARFLREADYDWKKAIRPLAAPMLSRSTLMNPFLVQDLWKKVGAVDATFLNFETMLFYNDSNLMLYPEGIAGIGKGYNHKYELQRFSSSFVYNSIKYRTDVLSMLTVNGENINPHTYSVKWIDNIVAKFGIPFLPLGLLTPFLLLQPWLFYFAFPAKLTFVVGKRYKPYEMTEKSIEELDRDELRDLAEEIRADMQKDLDKAVEEYAQWPYSIKEHFRILWDNWHLFPYTVPQGWPLLMSEFTRAYNHYEKTGEEFKMDLGRFSTIKILLRNPFLLSFFIPILGWIPILIRGMRK